MSIIVRDYRKLARSTLLFFLVTLTGASQANAPLELSFGLYASDKPTSLVKQFRPLLNQLEKDLAKALNRPVKIRLSITRSYHDSIDNLASGKVDFARFGPASYVLTKTKNPAITLLAMEHKKGKKEFNGVIAVHKNSSVKTIAQLKNKKFAFGNERSTIGRYLSQQYLLNHGIKAKDLKTFKYLGRHDKVGYAIAKGDFDAGALKESTYKKLKKRNLPLRALVKFKVVTKAWVASSKLDSKTSQTLSNVLINFNHTASLFKLKKSGFTQTSHRYYIPTENAIKANKQFFE